MHAIPSKSQIKEPAKTARPFVLYREIPLKGLTPTAAYRKLGPLASRAFLLESGLVGRQGKFSFLHLNPYYEISARGNRVGLFENGKKRVIKANPFDLLRLNQKLFNPVAEDFLSRFTGGLVGYLGYGAVRFFEDIPDRHLAKESPADLVFRRFRQTLAFDHNQEKALLSTLVMAGEDPDEAMQMLNKIAGLLQGESPKAPSKRRGKNPFFTSNMTDEAFQAIVRKAKGHIRSGDIFQVVLSRKFSAAIKATPFQVYCALQRRNPSPFMFFLDLGENCLAGSSPEKLVSLEGGVLETCPLAGTRPRSPETDDSDLASELINDPKERAEHVMLVDLARNDLGAIAKPGTVQVKDFMKIEKFSRVMHISSTVTGEMRESLDVFDALRFCLPAGTLSGAPKIRAMEIIDELEPGRRNFYGGCVCAIDHEGNLNSCITIRTMEYKDGIATVQAGAGVVADSDPVAEAMETRHKAQAVFEAIQLAEEGPA